MLRSLWPTARPRGRVSAGADLPRSAAQEHLAARAESHRELRGPQPLWPLLSAYPGVAGGGTGLATSQEVEDQGEDMVGLMVGLASCQEFEGSVNGRAQAGGLDDLLKHPQAAADDRLGPPGDLVDDVAALEHRLLPNGLPTGIESFGSFVLTSVKKSLIVTHLKRPFFPDLFCVATQQYPGIQGVSLFMDRFGEPHPLDLGLASGLEIRGTSNKAFKEEQRPGSPRPDSRLGLGAVSVRQASAEPISWLNDDASGEFRPRKTKNL